MITRGGDTGETSKLPLKPTRPQELHYFYKPRWDFSQKPSITRFVWGLDKLNLLTLLIVKFILKCAPVTQQDIKLISLFVNAHISLWMRAVKLNCRWRDLNIAPLFAFSLVSFNLLKSKSNWVRRVWRTMGISVTLLPLFLLTFSLCHITYTDSVLLFSCMSVNLKLHLSQVKKKLLEMNVYCTVIPKYVTSIYLNKWCQVICSQQPDALLNSACLPWQMWCFTVRDWRWYCWTLLLTLRPWSFQVLGSVSSSGNYCCFSLAAAVSNRAHMEWSQYLSEITVYFVVFSFPWNKLCSVIQKLFGEEQHCSSQEIASG